MSILTVSFAWSPWQLAKGTSLTREYILNHVGTCALKNGLFLTLTSEEVMDVEKAERSLMYLSI